MEDEQFYAPGHIGKPCAPRPRERLWHLRRNHRTVDAELLYHAEHGVEIQFLFNGELAYGKIGRGSYATQSTPLATLGTMVELTIIVITRTLLRVFVPVVSVLMPVIGPSRCIEQET